MHREGERTRQDKARQDKEGVPVFCVYVLRVCDVMCPVFSLSYQW